MCAHRDTVHISAQRVPYSALLYSSGDCEKCAEKSQCRSFQTFFFTLWYKTNGFDCSIVILSFSGELYLAVVFSKRAHANIL